MTSSTSGMSCKFSIIAVVTRGVYVQTREKTARLKNAKLAVFNLTKQIT